MDGVLDEVFVDMRVRWEVSDFIDECTEQLTRPRTKLDLFVEGQRRGIPITPVNTVADLRNDPHLRSAGFWRDEEHPSLGTRVDARAPRSASTTTGGTGRRRRRSASTPRPCSAAT